MSKKLDSEHFEVEQTSKRFDSEHLKKATCQINFAGFRLKSFSAKILFSLLQRIPPTPCQAAKSTHKKLSGQV